jgi:hypothetical protein
MAVSASRPAVDAPESVLSQRALNRATLARQMLLQRQAMPAQDVLEHLIGMQAQIPRDPYVGLWSRLDGFAADELAGLMGARLAVRAPLMRATIHMATARDALTLWPLMLPVLERNFYTGSPFGRNLKGMDVEQVLKAGRTLVEERPRTTAELTASLGERWPDRDGQSMAYAVNRLLPVVQVTPRGLWKESSQTAWTTFDTWLGQPLDPDAAIERLIPRYLAALGPASIADMQNWSGLTRLRDAFDLLRPTLVTFRDTSGKELFDLPDAPRPEPDFPAPVRFLPVYDNVLLGHADRSRFFAEDTIIPPYAGGGRNVGSILVDGFVRGIWKIEASRKAATLRVQAFEGIPEDQLNNVIEEGRRLLEFAAADGGEREVAFGQF